MLSENIKENKSYFVYLSVIGIVFYFMNHYTPLFSDDWHYNFIYGTKEEITSIADILRSQYIHYFQVNGRFVPHFFIQLFDGLLGKECFNVVNTFFFMTYLYLLSYTLKAQCISFYKSTSLVLFLTFLLPGFANNLLWMSGACNYLWVAVFLLSFNLLLRRNTFDAKIYPLLFVAGIFCGWTNEALVVGLGAGYFFYFLFNRKRLTTHRIVLLSGFYIGAMLLVFSPGSIHRASLATDTIFSFTDIVRSYLSALLAMNNLRIMFLFLILLIIIMWKCQMKAKVFIKDNQVLLIAVVISFFFVLFTRHDTNHSRFGIELFSLILISKLILKEWFKIYHFLNCIVLIFAGFCIYYMSEVYEDYKNIVNQIASKGEKLVLTNPVRYPTCLNNYIVNYNYPESISSPWIAKHFHKEELIFLPASLVNDIRQNTTQYDQIQAPQELPFHYIKHINKTSHIKRVIFELYPTNYQEFPFFIRPFVSKMERYTANSVTTERYKVVDIQEERFILIVKNPVINHRVKHIKIEYD